MSNMVSLATMRAAMVAADFNFANCGAVTALPAFLSNLNASYTCASVKNVLQGTSLVQLAANQFGTAKDPSTGLYGANIEGNAATNLALYSESAVVNWSSTGVTNAASTFFGATNAFYFVDNTIADRNIRQAISVTAGTTYTISAYVIMDDLSAPVVGTTLSTGDFSLLGDATVITSAALVEPQGGNVYRVSASVTAAGTASRLFGIYKESTQSAKGFRVTKIQVETGNIATSYILTTSSTATRAAAKLLVPLWKNNVLYSQDPSGTGWSRTNVTLTGGQSDSSGGTTAWKVEATATNTILLAQNTIVAPATVCTYSIKIKAGSGVAAIPVLLRNNTTSTNFTIGTFTTATGAISGAGWASVADGNGYYKLTFTQASGISVGDTLYFYVDGGTSRTAGNYFYFDSPQLEPGATATTYIPTTSTLDVSGNANIPGFSSAGYTLAADWRSIVARTTSAGLMELNDNTSSNRSNLTVSGSDIFNPNSVTGGASQMSMAGAACTTLRRKGAASYQVNNFLGANGGTALTADTSGTMPTGMLLLNLGSLNGGSSSFSGGYIYRAQLIPKVLTQAQLNGWTQ